MTNTGASGARSAKRARTASSGWPNGFLVPVSTTINDGATASRKGADDDVLLPWCGAFSRSAATGNSPSTSRVSTDRGMSAVRSIRTSPWRSIKTVEAALAPVISGSSGAPAQITSSVTSESRAITMPCRATTVGACLASRRSRHSPNTAVSAEAVVSTTAPTSYRSSTPINPPTWSASEWVSTTTSRLRSQNGSAPPRFWTAPLAARPPSISACRPPGVSIRIMSPRSVSKNVTFRRSPGSWLTAIQGRTATVIAGTASHDSVLRPGIRGDTAPDFTQDAI